MIRIDFGGREPLTKAELAERLGYSVRWIEGKLAEGMPSQMYRGKRVFREEEVRAWLAG